MLGISGVKRAVRRISNRIRPRPLVLCYHHIHDETDDHFRTCVSPKNLEEQLTVLGEMADVVPLEQVATENGRTRFSSRRVAITFDDGYANNFYRALPLLEKYDCAATVYVIAGALGRTRDFWWDELASLLLERPESKELLAIEVNGVGLDLLGMSTRIESLGHYFFGVRADALTHRQNRFLVLYDLLLRSEAGEIERILAELRGWAGVKESGFVGEGRRMMNDAEMSELSRSPMISVGGHTMNHPFLTAAPIGERWEELLGCKVELTRILGRTVDSFAYPFGDFDASTMSLAHRAGYKTAVTCEAKSIGRRANSLRLSRRMVGDWPGDVFEEKLTDWWREGS